MAQQINLLSATRVAKLKDRGFYGDGGGLYLQVAPGGTKSWVFRYKTNGKTRDMGLGSAITLGLAEAREKARECRKLRLDGIDPIDYRNQQKLTIQLESARTKTFDWCRDEFIKAKRWTHPKHKQQWENTLQEHVSPVFGKVPVADVDKALVLKALRPIWERIPETASRVRGRIEMILNWAKASGYRTGDNPAQWKGHLEHAGLEKHRGGHHASLHWKDAPAFLHNLRQIDTVSARALEFLMLTATSSGDIIGGKRDSKPPMMWEHVDFDARVWTVPSVKNKQEGVSLRVPLSEPAMAILEKMRATATGDLVFPGSSGKAMSENTMAKLIRDRLPQYVDRDKCKGEIVTPHGMRSTFRTWASEDQPSFAPDHVELCMRHVVGSKVQRAYQRGDALDQRRIIMDTWASYLEGRGADVINLAARR